MRVSFHAGSGRATVRGRRVEKRGKRRGKEGTSHEDTRVEIVPAIGEKKKENPRTSLVIVSF